MEPQLVQTLLIGEDVQSLSVVLDAFRPQFARHLFAVETNAELCSAPAIRASEMHRDLRHRDVISGDACLHHRVRACKQCEAQREQTTAGVRIA